MPVPIVNPKISDIAAEVGLSGVFNFMDCVNNSNIWDFDYEYSGEIITKSEIKSAGQFRNYGACSVLDTVAITAITYDGIDVGGAIRYRFDFSTSIPGNTWGVRRMRDTEMAYSGGYNYPTYAILTFTSMPTSGYLTLRFLRQEINPPDPTIITPPCQKSDLANYNTSTASWEIISI